MVNKGALKQVAGRMAMTAAAIITAITVTGAGHVSTFADNVIEDTAAVSEEESEGITEAADGAEAAEQTAAPWNIFVAQDYLAMRAQTKIVYTFGNHKEVLDWNTISEWTEVGNDLSISIDRDAVTDYVEKMAEKYDTRKHERIFKTTDGRTIEFTERQNLYGYTVDTEEEVPLLMSELKNGRSAEREPIYIRRNKEEKTPVCFERDGVDDLAGSYVEVDITNQHLWLYRDGELIIDTPVVTGCVANGKDTWEGVYPIKYTQKNAVLRGPGYEQPVSYWMPFYDGQGLHDANWRSEFGGTIYQYSGSHGCVNLPPEAAEVIYENVEAGMAVVLYK